MEAVTYNGRPDFRYNIVLFNCSVYLLDFPTADSQPVPSYVPLNHETRFETLPKVHILGDILHDSLRHSPARGEGGMAIDIFDSLVYSRDFAPPVLLRYAIHQKNQSAAELWLSAYLGNYIGNCLIFLNNILERVEIEPGTADINIKLLVDWRRVATILGGLAIFQVLFVLAAFFYCGRSCEIVDDVSTFSSMFTDFPFHSDKDRQQDGAVYQGKFVTEGNEFRWVVVEGAGPDI